MKISWLLVNHFSEFLINCVLVSRKAEKNAPPPSPWVVNCPNKQHRWIAEDHARGRRPLGIGSEVACGRGRACWYFRQSEGRLRSCPLPRLGHNRWGRSCAVWERMHCVTFSRICQVEQSASCKLLSLPHWWQVSGVLKKRLFRLFSTKGERTSDFGMNEQGDLAGLGTRLFGMFSSIQPRTNPSKLFPQSQVACTQSNKKFIHSHCWIFTICFSLRTTFFVIFLHGFHSL